MGVHFQSFPGTPTPRSVCPTPQSHPHPAGEKLGGPGTDRALAEVARVFTGLGRVPGRPARGAAVGGAERENTARAACAGAPGRRPPQAALSSPVEGVVRGGADLKL